MRERTTPTTIPSPSLPLYAFLNLAASTVMMEYLQAVMWWWETFPIWLAFIILAVLSTLSAHSLDSLNGVEHTAKISFTITLKVFYTLSSKQVDSLFTVHLHSSATNKPVKVKGSCANAITPWFVASHYSNFVLQCNLFSPYYLVRA